MNAIVVFGRYGPHASGMHIDRAQPLLGVIGSMAWAFDGLELRVRRIASIDELLERRRRR